MVDTTAGLAMRSTDRASPVIILSLAMVPRRRVSASRSGPRTGLVIGAFAVAAIAAAYARCGQGGLPNDYPAGVPPTPM